MAINACGSAIDYGLLLVLGGLLALPTPVATMSGLAAGATFNFVMNRRYAFADSAMPLASQALRYASVMLLLMIIHAFVVSLLRERFGVPLVFAKMLGDLGVLGLSQPFLLRRFVFPRPRAQEVAEGLLLAPAPASSGA
jgi:putative flippase GtrA